MIKEKNLVQRGQLWRKKDQEWNIIQIKAKRDGLRFTTLRLNRGSSKNKSHTMTAHDIIRFYELVK